MTADEDKAAEERAAQEAERGAELFDTFRRLDEAFRTGNMGVLRAAFPGEEFPNVVLPPALGMGDTILHYAVMWSPLAFIGELVAAGAYVNAEGDDGFPALFAAISADREDNVRIVELLLDAGADVHIRGINDWTPLHYAVAAEEIGAVRLLLARGADPFATTSIDDKTSPLDDAERMGFEEAAKAIREHVEGPRD